MRVPWSRGRQAQWLQPSPALTQHAGRAGEPCTRVRAAALSHRVCGTRGPGKVCRGRPAASPWDFRSRVRPLPSASPWRLLEVGGGKQTRRKAKYYECSWGDFRGGGGPEGMSGSQRQRPTTKGRVRGGERSLQGPPCGSVGAGPSRFPEAPKSLISLLQPHTFSQPRARPPFHPFSLGSLPASLLISTSGQLGSGPASPHETRAHRCGRLWLFFPTTHGSPRMNFSPPFSNRI